MIRKVRTLSVRDYGNPVMLLFRIRFILKETTGHPLLYPVNRRLRDQTCSC